MTYRIQLIFIIVFLPFLSFSQVKGKIALSVDDACFASHYEKIFVQTDKRVYATGSSLFYSALLVDGLNHKPEPKSKVLYFSISLNGQPVLTWKSEINNGISSGVVTLPDTIQTGYYTLKAYTNWMRNLPGKYIFKTPIVIVDLHENTSELDALKVKAKEPLPIVFLPEGGNLFAGIPNKIGFRGGNAYMKGKILDNFGDSVASFNANEHGSGIVTFTPEKEKYYFAQFAIQDNRIKTIKLPDADDFGFALHTWSDETRLIVNIFSSRNAKGYKLSLMNKGESMFGKILDIIPGKNTIIIDKTSLNSGVYLLTLASSMNDIVNERLLYILPGNQVPELTVFIPKEEYSTGETVRVTIRAKNLASIDTAIISATVSEVPAINVLSKQNDIWEKFNIHSEIPGLNLGPDQFIDENYVNDLLLAVPIENYIWRNNHIVNSGYNYLLEDRGFILEGRILNKVTLNPYANKSVILSVVGEHPNYRYFNTKDDGSFYFLLDSHYSNQQLILQMPDPVIRPNDITWIIENKKLGSTDNLEIISVPLTQPESDYLDYCRKIRLTELIFNLNATKVSDIHPETFSQKVILNPDYTVFPAEFVELSDFIEIAQNLMPAVRYRYNSRRNEYQLRTYDSENMLTFDEDATVFFNGVIMTDISLLQKYGTTDIEKIEVLLPRYFYGEKTFSGIISITTFDRKLPENYLNNNAYVMTNYIARDSKVTSNNINSEQQGKHAPDLRQNLYWGPQFKIGGNDELTLDFKTSDLKSEYEINIQGITNLGLPISERMNFVVK